MALHDPVQRPRRDSQVVALDAKGHVCTVVGRQRESEKRTGRPKRRDHDGAGARESHLARHVALETNRRLRHLDAVRPTETLHRRFDQAGCIRVRLDPEPGGRLEHDLRAEVVDGEADGLARVAVGRVPEQARPREHAAPRNPRLARDVLSGRGVPHRVQGTA